MSRTVIVGLAAIGVIVIVFFFKIRGANAGIVKDDGKANPMTGRKAGRQFSPPATMEVPDGRTTGSGNGYLPYAEAGANLACQIKGGSAQACENIAKLTKFTPLGYLASNPKTVNWAVKNAYKITPAGAAYTYGPPAFKRGKAVVSQGVNSVVNAGGKAVNFVKGIF